jgi:hypothetical protein
VDDETKAEEVKATDAKSKVILFLSPQDMQVLEELDEAYSNYFNESKIGLKAQVIWARRSALFSVVFIAVYLAIGVVFFSVQSHEWGFSDTCLFTVYTITSVGLGHLETPRTVAYQVFQIFFILIGIAVFALCLAQTFQYFSTSAHLATKAAGKAEVTRQGLERLEAEATQTEATHRAKAVLEHKRRGFLTYTEHCTIHFGKAHSFLEETAAGRVLSTFLPLLFIVLFGALLVGQFEGWSFISSIYFTVVVLTTVGYSDNYPETMAGIWSIIWLPYILIFTSLYLGAIANMYFTVARKCIANIEKGLKQKPIKSHVETGENIPSSHDSLMMVEAVSNEIVPEGTDAKDPEATGKELDNDDVLMKAPAPYPMSSNKFDSNFETFGDVIKAVQDATLMPEIECIESSTDRLPSYWTGQLKILSLQHSMDTPNEVNERPYLALRTLAKKRLAAIVAKEIAGGQSCVLSASTQGSSLLINLANSKEAAEKWFIPCCAHKVFSIVAFEAVFLVGENALLKEGKQAFYDLSPKAFHQIFSPLVVAMGDADTLESWLASTEILTENELFDEDLCREHKKMRVAKAMVTMPVNPGSAFNQD